MNSPQEICLAFLIVLFIFWSILFGTHTTSGFYNYLYSFLFGLIPLIGGLYAMLRSHVWGGLKSAIGKSVFFIGLGIFFWGCGEAIWSYYNFFMNVPAPYPSFADLGFAPSILFYGIGSFYLSKASGAKFALKNPFAKIFAIVAPILIWVISYYVLVVVARAGVLVPADESPLKAVLDIVYPFGDFISLTLAVVISGLSFKYLGGQYRMDIFSVLLGLFVMFIADSIFSYTTTVGTYYNANIGDLMLTFGLFFITFGVLGFCKTRDTVIPN